jgi:hypothetical protein
MVHFTDVSHVKYNNKNYSIIKIPYKNNIIPIVLDKDTYVIRSWLGPFSSASTQVIDTTLLGTVTIVITLAPASILMLGAVSDTSFNAIATATSQTGRAAAAQSTVRTADLAAEALNYKLSEIVLKHISKKLLALRFIKKVLNNSFCSSPETFVYPS